MQSEINYTFDNDFIIGRKSSNEMLMLIPRVGKIIDFFAQRVMDS